MTGAMMAAAIACTLAVAIATGDEDRPPTTGLTAAAEDPRRRPADGPNDVAWKRCASKDRATCVGLALARLADRLLMTNHSYPPEPGATGRRTFVDKLGRYLGALTLDVGLLDDATVRSVRELAEAATDAPVQSGRGKKQKYAQSILLAGWVTGAMLLALGMKTIAVLAGKALMTALMSLLLSALASFRGHGHAAEPKSTTTYEIVAKPVYSHSHHAAADAHAAGTQDNPAYRRSIGAPLAVHPSSPSLSSSSSDEEADHVVYRIHASDQTPIYIPIERRRRRRR